MASPNEAMTDAKARASRIKLMAFDVDGVLSDGSLFYTDEGVEIKAFNSLDGLGLNLLRKAGVTIAVITGRTTRNVEARMRHLGIDLLFQGSHDKLATMHELLTKLGLGIAEAGFMGDDIIDLKVMDACGFSAAPADGHPLAKRYAQLITSKDGGHGAVREVCEFILDAQGKLDAVFAPYLPVSGS